MKSIIFFTSVHHGNTRKIAHAIAEQLGAELFDMDERGVPQMDISSYDLVGLGSGVYRFGLSPKLFKLARSIGLKDKKVFLFSTSSSGQEKWHKRFKSVLARKNAVLLGEFVCLGFLDWAFFKKFDGGLNQGHPDEADLTAARAFADSLKKKI